MSDVPNRFGDYLRRIFNSRGPQRANLLTDIFPVVNLQEEAPQTYALRDEVLVSAYATIAAGGAGQYGRCFFGPYGQGRALVVTQVATAGLTVGRVILDVIAYATALVGTAVPAYDSSIAPAGVSPTAIIGTQTDTVAVAPTPAQAWVQRRDLHGTPALALPFQCVLYPGYVLRCATETANEVLEVNIFGYLMPLHGGEAG